MASKYGGDTDLFAALESDCSCLVKAPVNALQHDAAGTQASLATWHLPAVLRVIARLQHLVLHPHLIQNEALELSALGLDGITPAVSPAWMGERQAGRLTALWPDVHHTAQVPVSAFQVAATAPHRDLMSPFRAGEQVALPTVAVLAASSTYQARPPSSAAADVLPSSAQVQLCILHAPIGASLRSSATAAASLHPSMLGPVEGPHLAQRSNSGTPWRHFATLLCITCSCLLCRHCCQPPL